MSNGRTPFVGGNWKMNLTLAEASALSRAIADHATASAVEIALFPAFVHLAAVRAELSGATAPRLGAQDLSQHAAGAFTGEISAGMLRDAGATVVLTGHSERRHVIGESDELVGAKTAAAVGAGLTCVLCIGETLEEREAGTTDAVNARQLRTGLRALLDSEPADLAASLVIAYEPVWAIGTGRTASPKDAQAAHARVRAALASLTDERTADRTRIIYGGSMKPGNADDLLAQPDIDGGLIGGASLSAAEFLSICEAASAAAPA